MGNRKINQNHFLTPHFLKALLFQMTNICSRCVVSFTFNIYSIQATCLSIRVLAVSLFVNSREMAVFPSSPAETQF